MRNKESAGSLKKALLATAIAVVVVAAVGCSAATHGGNNAGPRRVTVPDGGIVPDVAKAGEALHLVFGGDGHAYYARSTNDGRTFSPAVRLSNDSSKASLGHERGPKLAIGRDGSIHAAWANDAHNKVFYSRSTDGGRNFTLPRNVAPEKGLDGPSIAADANGNVYVVWMAGEARGGAAASLIHLTKSADNGATFSAAEPIATNYPNNAACACCNLKAFIGPGGRFFIGLRGANNNIRDVHLLRATPDGSRFEAFRVSEDNWRLEGCPMQGPWVETAPDGRVLTVAWSSQGQVYYAISADGGMIFSPRSMPLTRPGSPRRDPLALRNARGEILFAWVEQSALRWEHQRPPANVESGTRRDVPRNSRPVAFVDSAGEVALVY